MEDRIVGSEQNDTEDIPFIPSDWAEIKPYKRTIIFNDDTVLDGYAAKASIANELWVYPEDSSIGYLGYATIFSDTDKTSRIQCMNSADEIVEFVGYTRLININTRIDGSFAICLVRPND